MRAGIRDVVDLTRGSEELRDAVERAIQWAENVSHARGQKAATTKHRGSIISVFASKGGVGKTFLTTNLAAALAGITKQETAVADLDVNMGDVFSYFGREPAKEMADLLALGERVDREVVFANGTKLDEHLWGFGAVPDLPAPPPGGEAVGKYLRTLRENFAFVVVDASAAYTDLALGLLRPVGRHLPRDDARRRGRQAPLEGARHAAHDRSSTRAVPGRPESGRQPGRPGSAGRGTGHEAPGGHPDPVQPPRANVPEQGTARCPGGAGLRGRRQHLPVRLTVRRCTLGPGGRRAHADPSAGKRRLFKR